MSVGVRYIVDDVGAAADFYCERLGFSVERGPGPGFVMLARGELRLFLNEPGAGGAGQPVADGRMPEPGGWNRIQLETEDVEEAAAALRDAGVTLRGDVVQGRGGKQVVVEDPSGNPIELFEPGRAG